MGANNSHRRLTGVLFQMGEYWYLIFSTFSDQFTTHYRIGKSPNGPWIIPEDDVFDTRSDYAIKTASDGKRRYAFGWIASKYGNVPKPTKDCVKCGLCAEKCPVQAINSANFTADSKKCISCMRCVKLCSHDARKVNGAMVSIAAMAIKKACSVRKENELFL